MTSLFRAFLAGAALAAVISAGPVLAETMSFKADLKPAPGVQPTTGQGNLPRPTTPKAASFPGRATYRGSAAIQPRRISMVRRTPVRMRACSYLRPASRSESSRARRH